MSVDHPAPRYSPQAMRPLLCPVAGGIAIPVQLSLRSRPANKWSAIHGWSTAISSLSAEESTRLFASTRLTYSPSGALSSMGCSTTTRSGRWTARSKKPKPKSNSSETTVSESSAFLFTSLQRIRGLPLPPFVPSAQVSRWKVRRPEHQGPADSPHRQTRQVRVHAYYPIREGRSHPFQIVSRLHRRHKGHGHGPQHAPRPAQKPLGCHSSKTEVGRRSCFSSLLNPDSAAGCPDGDPQFTTPREEIDRPDLSTDPPHRHGSLRRPVSTCPARLKFNATAARSATSGHELVPHAAPVGPRTPSRCSEAHARSLSRHSSSTHTTGREPGCQHSIPPTRHIGSVSCITHTTTRIFQYCPIGKRA
jgi:hypothetical protein